MAEGFFPEIEESELRPENTYRLEPVDLTEFADTPDLIVDLRVTANVSQIMEEELPEKEAKKYASAFRQQFGVPVRLEIVQAAHRLALAWKGPELKAGHLPNRDDMVKFSIKYGRQFLELMKVLGSAGDGQVEATEEAAKSSFFEREPHTNGSASPPSPESNVIPESEASPLI